MKMRLEKGKPLNLNDQINAIGKGLLPMIGTPTATMRPRSGKFREGRTPNPAEYAQMWPTPCQMEPEKDIEKYKNKLETPRSERGGGNGPNLATAVKLWPTPRNNHGPSTDKKHMSLDGAVKIYPTPTVNGNNNEIGSSPKSGDGLATAVKKSLWGTPTANDAKNTLMESQRGRGTLTAHIVETEGKQDGQLNPDWVEALMGYPIGWTDVSKGAITEIDYFEAWGNGTWENGLSPVTTGKKYRISRLKCLGNAVVPEIPAIIIQQIVRVLWLQ